MEFRNVGSCKWGFDIGLQSCTEISLPSKNVTSSSSWIIMLPSKDVFPYKLQNIPKESLFFPVFLVQTQREMSKCVSLCHNSELIWKKQDFFI